MVRYSNRRDHQTKALFRNAEVQVITSQQLLDAVYKKLCLARFFTQHRVHRVTTNEFLAMLAAAQLKQIARVA